MPTTTAIEKCLAYIEDPRDVDIIWHAGQDAKKELAALKSEIEECRNALSMLIELSHGAQDEGLSVSELADTMRLLCEKVINK